MEGEGGGAGGREGDGDLARGTARSRVGDRFDFVEELGGRGVGGEDVGQADDAGLAGAGGDGGYGFGAEGLLAGERGQQAGAASKQ